MKYSRRVYRMLFILYISVSCMTDKLDDGGWKLVGEVPVNDDGRCNIEKVDGRTLTQDEFLNKYAYTKPIIIENIENEEFRRLTRKERMLNDWNKIPIFLNSANTHSYKRVESTFDEYLDKYLKPQSLTKLGNETLYLFGDLDSVTWSSLLEKYNKPRWFIPGHEAALSFGIAGRGTGVPFHFHGPGFAEVIYGRKRWFLTPHEKKPRFDPDKSTLDWYINDYPRLAGDELPFECLMRPGELIFFPDKWYHATLNMDTSVFISTFLSPILSKKIEL